METSILYQIRMGFILENETASILARMKTIRKGFRAWNHPMLAHSRPNITHLATNFVSLSDSSETHLSTGRVRQTFASNGKRRAGRDGLGEVKGPRYTASTPPHGRGSFAWSKQSERYRWCRAERPARSHHRRSQLG